MEREVDKRSTFPLTDLGRFVAQRTIVEGHQCFEHVRFAAECVVDGIFDPMFEQIPDPIALIFVIAMGTVEEFAEERNMH